MSEGELLASHLVVEKAVILFGEGVSLIQGGPESKVSNWSGGESLASH